jgi:hypothetical protein
VECIAVMKVGVVEAGVIVAIDDCSAMGYVDVVVVDH